MLIWLILGLSFLAGVHTLVNGKLKTSKRRELVGTPAKVVVACSPNPDPGVMKV